MLTKAALRPALLTQTRSQLVDPQFSLISPEVARNWVAKVEQPALDVKGVRKSDQRVVTAVPDAEADTIRGLPSFQRKAKSPLADPISINEVGAKAESQSLLFFAALFETHARRLSKCAANVADVLGSLLECSFASFSSSGEVSCVSARSSICDPKTASASVARPVSGDSDPARPRLDSASARDESGAAPTKATDEDETDQRKPFSGVKERKRNRSTALAASGPNGVRRVRGEIEARPRCCSFCGIKFEQEFMVVFSGIEILIVAS